MLKRGDVMNKLHAAVIKKADALFQTASFVGHINSDDEYQQSIELMDTLIEDYDHNRSLIEVLSIAIERWENEAKEFTQFNRRIKNMDVGLVTLKTLMEQYELGVADLPEIGSKSLVSKILHGERRLTRDHIDALSKRFGISPALFF